MLRIVLVCICIAVANIKPVFSQVDVSLNVSLPNPAEVTFFLYNKPSQIGTYQSGVQLIANDPSTLLNTGISPSKPLIVLIHGYLQDHQCGFPQDIKDAYLSLNQGINVITVDYGTIACANLDQELAVACYPTAAQSTGIVGQAISDFLWTLYQKGLINPDNTRLAGISLGAHVAGETGNRIKSRGLTLSRISGMDPAGPVVACGTSRCLSKTDAKFVDVIHTDMGGLGTKLALGHIDFYANGGTHPQPTCEGKADSCSHASSASYWLQSIGTSSIKGYQCDSYASFTSGLCGPGITAAATFGDSAQPGPTGAFYLNIYPLPLSNRYTCYDTFLEDLIPITLPSIPIVG